jgi:hypothetical protein
MRAHGLQRPPIDTFCRNMGAVMGHYSPVLLRWHHRQEE